jgi:hypothetical protein
MYTAPNKVASHLKAAEEGGVCYVVYSTREELTKIKKFCPSARYGIRQFMPSHIECFVEDVGVSLLQPKSRIG